jgi:hypothetical protein
LPYRLFGILSIRVRFERSVPEETRPIKVSKGDSYSKLYRQIRSEICQARTW